jgi:alpha-mannosidase
MDALAENLPEYRGELYLEYHRGTLTSRRRMKQRYRACERALQTLEAVHVAKGLGPVDEQPWKRLALMQFHDVLPGSSIEQVYQAVEAELERMETDLLDEARRLLNDETDQGPTCLFNPLPIARSLWWSDTRSGRPKRVDLPPLSAVDVDAGAPQEPPEIAADAEGISSDRVRVCFDQAGRVRALSVDGRELRLAAAGNQLVLYRELPAMFDVWDIDQQSLVEGQALESPAEVEICEADPAGPCVAFTHRVGPSRITVRYRLLPGEPVVRIEYDVDWQHTQTLLKTHWPTDYQGGQGRFGCPFGSFLRPAQPGRDREQAMWEVGASRWACVFDEGEREGLAVITESSYGFSCRSGEMTASLIRSPMRPESDAQRLGEVLLPQGADYGAQTAPEMFTDLGQHTIRLAVGAYDASGPGAELPAVLAETLYTPPLSCRSQGFSGPMPELSGAATLAPCWARPLEDGSWELRLHEIQGRHGQLELAEAATPAARTTLDGRDHGQCGPTIDFSPFEIVTLRFNR